MVINTDYYLQQARYELLQAINLETKKMKDILSNDVNADMSCYFQKIDSLASLRTQIKDLIEDI